jgi:dolichol-phosphate mannosyltransferase
VNVKVSVILPTYNEALNIVALIEQVLACIPAGVEPEIVLVDDNSPDDTYRIVVKRFANDPRVVPFLRTTDRGLASSVRAGIEHSTGDQVVVMDTDFTHDPAEIPRLLHVGQLYDLVSGSRFCAGGRMQDNAHYLASLFYNWMLRALLRTQVQDNLGGFFTITRRALEHLPFDRIFIGYGDYFFRLIYFSQRLGYSIVEIPAEYKIRTAGHSKSSFMRMLFSYSWAAIRLRLNVLVS